MTKTILRLEYERYVELFDIRTNRERKNVVARFAFMVSARRAFTTSAIGKVMDKNHATVIHATKAHEMNHKFDEDYRKMFEVTEAMIDGLIHSDEYLSQSHRIDTVLENIKLRTLVHKKTQDIIELESKLQKYEYSG